jgi:hypothetical protein
MVGSWTREASAASDRLRLIVLAHKANIEANFVSARGAP